MASNFLSLARTVVVTMSVAVLMVGCGQMNSTPAKSSFAQAPVCLNNAFLQKYNCDTINIQRAAVSGDPDAQYALGYLYYYGVGVVANEQAALVWIRKAAAQDQPLAKQALLIMEKGSSAQSDSSATTYPATPTAQPVSSIDQINNTTTPNQPLSNVLPAYGQTSSSAGQSSQSMMDTLNTSSQPTSSSSNSTTATGFGTSVAANVSKVRSTSLTADERYLLSVNPNLYTLQLMGSHNLQSILDFIQTNQLNGQVNYYKIALQGKPWYLLIYGQYANKTLAQSALQKLSTSVRAQNPWVRSFSEIQHDIKST